MTAAREDGPLTVRVDGRPLGLFYHEGAFYATDNCCAHIGFPLTDGSVDLGVVEPPAVERFSDSPH